MSSKCFDPLDVADVVAVEHQARDVIETQGVPDLLLNNAALINRNAVPQPRQ
jgi:NAD(P)-dependent dehydrogenase (short-subunit alcohol dehydrogenase family)